MFSGLIDQIGDVASRLLHLLVASPGQATLVDTQQLDVILPRTMPPPDRDIMVEALSDEWLRTKVVSAQLANQLNQLRAPLLRLPLELLQDILAFAVSDAANSPGHLLRWVDLGHICHYIRLALLAMHGVWANAVFTPCRPEITEELHRRAAGVPLSIRLCEAYPAHLIDHALVHVGQARSITICSESAFGLLLPRLTGATLPQLECLVLDNGRRGDPAIDHDLRISLEPMCAPRLLHLRLRDVLVPVIAQSLTDLSLELTGDIDIPGIDCILIQIYSTLRSCTRLTALHIRNGAPRNSPVARQFLNSEPISLPFLRKLDICDTSEGLAWLWSFLLVPPEATVIVRQHDWLDDTFKDLSTHLDRLHAFARHVHDAETRPISGLALRSLEGVNEINFKIYATTSDTASNPSDDALTSPLHICGNLVLDLYLRDVACAPQSPNVGLAQLSDMFGLANIEALEWDCDAFSQSDHGVMIDALQFLSQFCNLRTLYLTGNAFSVYSAIADVPPEGYTGSVVCPKLHSLVITQPVIVERNVLKNLLSVLKCRVVLGAPLQELWMELRMEGVDSDEQELLNSFCTQIQAIVPFVYLDELDELN